MILTFMVDKKEEAKTALDCFVMNFEEKLPSELKVFLMTGIKYKFYKSELEHLVVLDYGLFINLVPKWFFYFVIQKSLKKQGYTGSFRRVKSDEAIKVMMRGSARNL